jgi:hypothetical protein
MRIKGEARTELAAKLRHAYEAERLTIRQLTERFELSYGTTHALLREAKTPMRPRGGNHAR